MRTWFWAYGLKLNAPAVLTGLEGDPNAVWSYDFIPGAAIRGAVARAVGSDAALMQQLVLSGGVQYLNAHPEEGGHRTLPLPLSYRTEKYGTDRWDLAHEEWPDTQLEAEAATYGTIDGSHAFVAMYEQMATLHQQRDRARGRPHAERGQIFTYQAIPAGSTFRGLMAIRADAEPAARTTVRQLDAALKPGVYLGRSRNSEYGAHATLTSDAAAPLLDCEAEQGNDVISIERPAALPVNTEFRVLLTSDYIGRNAETGQVDPLAVRSEVIDAFRHHGIPLAVSRGVWGFRTTGGYNRTWGLPLPQATAMRAGSVMVCRASATVPIDTLRIIEQAGLGERRIDGFGRFLFLNAATRQARLLEVRRAAPPLKPAGEMTAAIRAMTGRLLQDEIDRRIAALASRLAATATGPRPSKSLLGRLRVPLRGQAGLETLAEWLAPTGPHRLRRPAARQLAHCRIGVQTLGARLSELAQNDGDSERLATDLAFTDVARRAHVDDPATAQALLRESTFLRRIRAELIDALLAQLARPIARENRR